MQKLQIFLFLEIFLLKLSQFSLYLMEFFLKFFIWISILWLLNQLKTFSLVLLFKIRLELFELLIFGNKRISKHIYLRFLSCVFFLVDLLDSLENLMHRLDLTILVFNDFIELSFLSLEKLSSSLLLISLSHQTLWGKLHFCA